MDAGARDLHVPGGEQPRAYGNEPVAGAAASWTAKLLPEVASSAVTGTDRTFLALLWTKFTLTEAWSRPPPFAGLSSSIVTGTVE